jgi:hypothetical protein
MVFGPSMTDLGASWQKGYVVRLIHTINKEEVDLTEHQDYCDAYRQIGTFIEHAYMHTRIHSPLGYLTISEF